MPYAADTDVPVERSKQHIEGMLRVRGAKGFASAWDEFGDRIEFLFQDKRIRFHLPRASAEQFSTNSKGATLQPAMVERRLQQHDRSRWRALYLVVKAKLEAADAGISTIEEEFLAHIVDPETDKTVGEVLIPRIQSGSKLSLPKHAGASGRG